MTVQPGLCRTWSQTPKTGFLRTRLLYSDVTQSDHRTTLSAPDAKLKMSYITLIFCILTVAPSALALSADVSSWKDSGAGLLLQNKRSQLQVYIDISFIFVIVHADPLR